MYLMIKECEMKTSKKSIIRFTVVYNIPVNPDSSDYIAELVKAATIISSNGLEVSTTKFSLPKEIHPVKI